MTKRLSMLLAAMFVLSTTFVAPVFASGNGDWNNGDDHHNGCWCDDNGNHDGDDSGNHDDECDDNNGNGDDDNGNGEDANGNGNGDDDNGDEA